MKSVLFVNLNRLTRSTNSFGSDTKEFMKYFPKYQRSMRFSDINGPMRHKIKSMKVIKQFYISSSDRRNKSWRPLLVNKMKSVKALTSAFSYDPYLVKKVELLTGLKQLQILLDRSPYGPKPDAKKEDIYMRKICKKMKCLQNLKSLEIVGLPTKHNTFIKELASAQRLLGSLKKFIIYPDLDANKDTKFIEIVSSQKKILKHVTNLTFGPLFSPSHFKFFQDLADSCPKLSSLYLEIFCRNITFTPMGEMTFAKKEFPVTTNYLSTLKTFHNLHDLRLSIADTPTLIRDLALPPSIQNLALYFQENLTKDVMLKIDKTFTDNSTNEPPQVFEHSETLLNFYNNFQSLHHLETLTLAFELNCDQETFKYHSYLYQSLLRRVPTLQNLIFNRCFSSGELNKPMRCDLTNYYLPQTLESCQHLGHTLETIKIGYERAVYPQLDLSPSRNKFNKLSKITIIGKVEDKTSIPTPHKSSQLASRDRLNDRKNDNHDKEKEDFSSTDKDDGILHILEQFIALGDSITSITLCTFRNPTVQSLLGLLKQLNKLERPNQLHISIQIRYLNSQDLEYLDGDFEQLLNELNLTEKGYLKARGVSLKLFTEVKTEYVKDFLKIFGEKFDSFKIDSRYQGFGV